MSSTEYIGNAQSKNWCFTINNPKPNYEDMNGLKAKDYTYCVVGKEVGKDGTPHLQGFVMLTKRVRFTKIKGFLPRAHIEPMFGNSQQAADYCKKDGDYEEHGTFTLVSSEGGGGAIGGKAKHARYKSAIQLAKAGDFEQMEEVHPDMYWNNTQS